MRSALAERVYPIFHRAFELRDRLQRGEKPALGVEQSVFQGLLSGNDDNYLVDYDGDRAAALPARPATSEPHSTAFLGARYALVCWLDELFVLDAPWSERWNEHKLEVALYASNDRAWQFWSQARLAASRGLVDALEVFYLSAMLGFRGEMREQPEKLAEWFEVVRQQIRSGQARRWEAPADLLPLSRVPVLRGRRDLRALLMTTSLSLLLLIPVVVLLILRIAG
jgi:hypothetical protein